MYEWKDTKITIERTNESKLNTHLPQSELCLLMHDLQLPELSTVQLMHLLLHTHLGYTHTQTHTHT